MKKRNFRRRRSVFGADHPGPETQEEWHPIQDLAFVLRASVQEASDQSVKPFLVERIQRRLKPVAKAADTRVQYIWQTLRPAGLAALAIIGVLATYNATRWDTYGAQRTAIERILGLEPITLTASYAIEMEPSDLLEP